MLALKVMHRVVLSSRLRRTVAALAVFALMLLSGSALASTYYNVDGEMGGVMKFDPPNPGAAFDDVLNRWTFTVGVRNTGATTQKDVHYVQQFLWDDAPQPFNAFTWDNIDQRWEHGTMTWAAAADPGQFAWMSMDRDNIDTPLDWPGGDRVTAYVQETDLLPAVKLGDFAPNEQKTFKLYADVSSQYDFHLTGLFVAAPEPSTLTLLAVGAGGLLAWVVRRRR